MEVTFEIQTKTNSVVFGLQATYTDWASATSRRILVPTFVDRELSRGQRGGTSTAVRLGFLDWSRYVFFQVAPQSSSRGWVAPFQTQHHSENLVALRIESWSSGSVARNSDH
jgi:hypothetical protein